MSTAQLTRLFETAVAQHRAGKVAEAAELYARIRQCSPKHFDAHHLGGTAALQLGQPKQAVALLRSALLLNPQFGVCQMRLGLAYLAVGDAAMAEQQLRELLVKNPRMHEAWDNLGMVLKVAGRLDEAMNAHRRAVEIHPAYAPGWYNLGMAHSLLGRPAAALSCHTRALVADPNHPAARFGRAQSLQQLHRIDEAIGAYDEQLARFPRHFEARSSRLFALNYSDRFSPAELFLEHLKYGQDVEGGKGRTPIQKARPPASPRRRKLAFLSSDLRTHSVAFFLEPILSHLDRSRFEVVLYHDHFVVDSTSERLKAQADIWRNFIGVPDDVVEAQIRADQPDVLVDLTGHTSFNRLPLFARRLAPVQITYLGYPNTTGLQNMDFRLTDAHADPVGEADAHHTETLLRIANCAWSYSPPADAPTPPPLPSANSDAPIRFGSFNNFAKLSDATLALWSRILVSLPHSRLVLKSATDTDVSFSQRLLKHGIAIERVTILPASPGTQAHLASYSQVDIALDPTPYAGTTTTCEALWMGRPVITLAGSRHASRVGVSLLHAAGHREWVAEDPDQYVALAVALAADRIRLGEISRSLRSDLQQSVLCDHAGHARRFADALEDACELGATRSTDVSTVAA